MCFVANLPDSQSRVWRVRFWIMHTWVGSSDRRHGRKKQEQSTPPRHSHSSQGDLLQVGRKQKKRTKVNRVYTNQNLLWERIHSTPDPAMTMCMTLELLKPFESVHNLPVDINNLSNAQAGFDDYKKWVIRRNLPHWLVHAMYVKSMGVYHASPNNLGLSGASVQHRNKNGRESMMSAV